MRTRDAEHRRVLALLPRGNSADPVRSRISSVGSDESRGTPRYVGDATRGERDRVTPAATTVYRARVSVYQKYPVSEDTKMHSRFLTLG